MTIVSDDCFSLHKWHNQTHGGFLKKLQKLNIART